MALVSIDAANQALLTNLIGSGDQLDGLEVHLFKEELNPTSATLLSTLQAAECAFPGYGAVACEWEGVYVNDSGDAEIHSQAVSFTRTSSAGDSESVYGYWLELDPYDVVVVQQFDTPEPMSANLDHLAFVVKLKAPIAGSSVIID